jgi:hypothetical protein
MKTILLADGFDHTKQIANRGDRVRLPTTGLYGHVDEICVMPGGWSYLIRLDDGGHEWLMGDELIIEVAA